MLKSSLKISDLQFEKILLIILQTVPWGFRKLLCWIKEQYDNPPVFITENGYSDSGDLNDEKRIFYYTVSQVLERQNTTAHIR